jgi:hypothetical protein
MNSWANRSKPVETGSSSNYSVIRFNGFYSVSPGIHSWAR